MKKFIVLLLATASIHGFANDNSVATTDLTNSQQYCTKSGGQVLTMQAQFNINGNTVNGVSKQFCKFIYNGNLAYVGLDTLSTLPSLAATYTQRLQVNNVDLLPTKPNPNPSINVCELLHGAEIGFSVIDGGFVDPTAGQTDICVFGDGSSISAWSMIYAAAGSRPDLKNIIRSTPLNINPHIA